VPELLKKAELLAPAGNLEKLKMAILYGADAIYIGGKSFGLRAGSDNFTLEEMKEGIAFSKERGKKVYLTLNAILHNDEVDGLEEYLKEVSLIGLDGLIISDPGVFSMAKEITPHLELHISTQANNTNHRSVKFWGDQGAKRVVLARELSLYEISTIQKAVKGTPELEVFIHGAMCISYSGRCLLSTYMTGRDANRGQCAQPCRWNYTLMEQKRPGEYFPVIEEDMGTYIFNSKDLCMLPYLPQLLSTGVVSLKIEGRMKSSFYVATVVKAYRQALDQYYAHGENDVLHPKWMEELMKVSHRDYTTGFYFNKPDGNDRVFASSAYHRNYDFVGLVLAYDKQTKRATVEQRNKISKGDTLEVVEPQGEFFIQTISTMKNEKGEEIQTASHPQMIFTMEMTKEVQPFSMLRRKGPY
jgi:U32 family peptidase